MARDFVKERCAQLAKEMTPMSDAVIAEIMPFLASLSPMTQGAIIAELAAIWLGGHPPKMRDELLKINVQTTVLLIDLHDAWKNRE